MIIMSDMIYDYLIIGAGPSGLTFTKTLSTIIPKPTFIIFDMGNDINERDKYDKKDSAIGTGGAGLFSDGKFSFYPSGTHVYELNLIRKAYEILSSDLLHFDITLEDFPNKIHEDIMMNNSWNNKSYPSQYMSLENRIALINYYKDIIDNSNIINNHKVLSWTYNNLIYCVSIINMKTNELINVKTRKIIAAGGRFHPIELSIKKDFKRLEYGVRIVFPSLLITDTPQLDPKYKYYFNLNNSGNTNEFRTFCWCKNGMVVNTISNIIKDDTIIPISTFSGRADCEPTGISNFGLNVIIRDKNYYDEELLTKIISIKPFEFSLQQVINNNDFIMNLYGKFLGELLIEAINKIIDKFPQLLNDQVKIIGPTLEGIGCYPDKICENENIFCIGDCSGSYRGIIPAMLSGYELALRFV